jgi:tripartite-type tricarboxylate transporter receptor subunit TctC
MMAKILSRRRGRVREWDRCFPALMLSLAIALVIGWQTQNARAQDYPNRTVKVIIPFTAGGAPDVLFRLVAQALSEKWGHGVIIENRAGGNTIPGTLAATKSAPDGYTLLFTADGTFVLNPLLYSSLPYSLSDLVPIVLVGTTPHILAVSKATPANTVQEFVALAKAKPNTLTYGTTGPASIQRLAMEFFSRIAGIELVHVPYRGANETTTAIVAGEIDATINGASNILPHMPTAAVKALAISTKERSPLAPELPTMQEAGVPGYSSQGAFGLLAPVGVPDAVRSRIYADVAEVLKKPDLRKAAEARSFQLYAGNGDEFQRLIEEETSKWRRVIEEAKIKIE